VIFLNIISPYFNEDLVSIDQLQSVQQDSPSPIALEPCCGNRAAVLSLLVRLPTGGETFTPSGQSGESVWLILMDTH
jgi:hypothetical protein